MSGIGGGQLTAEAMAYAEKLAQTRQVEVRERPNRDEREAEQYKPGLERDREGARGEVAFAYHHNIPWPELSGSPGEFADVGGYQVKTTLLRSPRRDPSTAWMSNIGLIIRPAECDPALPYTLVVINTIGQYFCYGWILGEDALKYPLVRPATNRKPAHEIPWNRLWGWATGDVPWHGMPEWVGELGHKRP